ncbi:MAG TPA: hypothetical protein DER10_10145 [Elusimicrobia bacterium]|nr:MAG: hypothetical protein A2X33_07885 [Elusimicrobia bacterium GWA2_51_34]HAF95587.1 hypothetical protein [Elusimicrobiota bacterium]HCE98842.1 hypothetical protein [Elusimicrobiota bacterium]
MLLFFIFGFFALLSQTLLLREISFLFTAHELSIACSLAFWLFWTGAGITAAKKHSRLEALAGNESALGPAFVVFALAMPACMLAARQAARLAQTGLMPGFLEMIAGTFLLTMPAAFAGGLATAAGLRNRGVYFYAAEAAGGALAGICALLYLRYFPGFGALKLTVVSGAILAAAALISHKSQVTSHKPEVTDSKFVKPLRILPFGAIIALFAFFYFSDARSIFLKGGARPAEVFNSTGSRLTAAYGVSGGTDLTENGALLAALPDESGTYETFALPLLARAKPQKILIAGEKAFFAASELLKYKPAFLEVAEPDHFRARYLLNKLTLKSDSVKLINEDARQLIASSTGGYSAIMLASGGPVNAAANRLYTLEFFRLAAEKLKPDGLLVFELPFSENYISPEQGYLAACLINTARLAFENIALIPASRLIVIASRRPVKLDPAVMAGAYSKRKLANRNAVPSAFPFLLDPNRVRWAQTGLDKIKNPQVNSDLDPVSYFYFWRLWLSMVASPSMLLGLALTALIFIVSFARLFGSTSAWREPAGASSLLIGFWGMAFEAGVILVFQTLTGQLAWKLGALFSAFLAGAALGVYPALWPFGKKCGAGLLLAEFMALGLSVLAAAVLKNSFAYSLNTVFICSILGLAVAGTISGAYFSCASTLNPQKGPGVYARDLAGAALGAFAASAFVVPLWGLESAFLLSAAAALLSLMIDGRYYLKSLKS